LLFLQKKQTKISSSANKIDLLVPNEAAAGGILGRRKFKFSSTYKSRICYFVRLIVLLSTTAVVSSFSLPPSAVTTLSTPIANQRRNKSPTIIMATPQRLIDAFEASDENSNRDSNRNQTLANGAAANANHTCKPVTAAPLQNLKMGNTNKRVAANQSPIGKHLPRPMRMAEIITTSKREGYLGWDDYFLGIAVLSSQRSKDPDHAEGACIADAANKIVAIGYSGLPRGCPDTIFPWKDFNEEGECTENNDAEKWLHSKRPFVCDAATNAVLNKGSQDLTGCRLYVTSFPTSDSVKVMIQSGIQELIILQKDKTVPGYGQNAISDGDSKDFMNTLSSTGTEDELAGGVMLAMADIQVRYYRPPISSVALNFDTEIVSSTSTASSTSIPTEEEVEAAAILREEADYDALSLGVGNNGRRENYLSWDDYFMSVALLTAQRSKDPSTIVGACIVDDHRRIVGLGYNGMPRGLSDDLMPWAKHNSNPLFNKYKYVTHAEVNAILNSNGSYSSHVDGGTIYVSLFPCENCTKMIIQSGIKKVVYLKDIYHNTDGCRASRVMMRCAKIEVQQYHPKVSQVDVDFYEKEGVEGRNKKP
jgi:dCMP deaminase